MPDRFSPSQMSDMVEALTDQIADAFANQPFAIVGIRSRGDEVAERIHARLVAKGRTDIDFGVLDISLYRDDYAHLTGNPILQGSEIDFDVDGTHVVLIDDVLFTGRTIVAALSALNDYGRAASVRLGVLIDRGWRELPICPDFVGETLNTKRDDRVVVSLQKTDGADRVEVVSATQTRTDD